MREYERGIGKLAGWRDPDEQILSAAGQG